MTQPLSAEQAQSLFEYLTLTETYREVEQYKHPEAILNYGTPFQDALKTQRSSPLLQSLLVRLGLKVPGLRDVSDSFWKIRCKNIIQQLGEAQLSESYDKGSLTRRKTLAAAFSTIIAPLVRGLICGVQKVEVEEADNVYDSTNSVHATTAWDNFVHHLVYDDMVDKLVDTAAKTEKLSDHSSLVQAAHEYILVNIASFLHQIFVRSPDGQLLLGLLESVHRLVPYAVIRQTLKVSNAATMMYGMTKLLLSKLSVGSITNWIGISNGANEGMNLVQHIISTVYTWEIKELQRRALKIERNDECLGKNYMSAIKGHVRQSREIQEHRRNRSRSESKSIIRVILEDSETDANVSQTAHDVCMEYLAIQLSIQDREVLSDIFCRQQPDYLTQSIYDLVAAYDPIIRSIHNAVDLSATLADLENFIIDFLKCAKAGSKASVKAGNGDIVTPSIEDFVLLLRKHASALHRYLHLVTSKCKDLTEQYRSYAKELVSEFKCSDVDRHANEGAGNEINYMNKLVSSLGLEDQTLILKQLNEHAEYLAIISACSSARLHSIYSSSGSTFEPPGAYPARWQSLIDNMPVTPATPLGSVRYGRDRNVRAAARVDVNGEVRGFSAITDAGDRDLPEPPDMKSVEELLLRPFINDLNNIIQI